MPKEKDLPESLRHYVVRQDYARYDAADQAVWRFVILHLQRHLEHAAHESYLAGLRGSALSAEAIPRIDEVHEALSRHGWGAAAVSGFIPPRAFQRFQALGILPIAADIRAPNHVAYTPAPDIIHEAAGHAPILINPEYAEYLRRSGHAGELAFSCPEDHALTRAITHLSRVKELYPEGSETIASAERDLEIATRNLGEASEAARMARLYWWTAEYGLIGTPEDFKLYGAGLLSSLGEAVYCLADAVRKLPLDTSCLDVGYDITRPQPQLFVTPSFAALFDVLDDATAQLAARRGVAEALSVAEHSRLPARVEIDDGSAHMGTVTAHEVTPGFTFFAMNENGSARRFIIGCDPRLDERGRERGATTLAAKIAIVLPADEMNEPVAKQRIAPAFRNLDTAERALRDLYDQAAAAWKQRQGSSFVQVFERVHRELTRAYPDEWLLRWNLLENLLALGETERTTTIARELELLEGRFREREPIATGLCTLRERVRAASQTLEHAP